MHLYEDMPLYAQPPHVIFAYVYKYTIKNNINALVSYQTDIDNRASNCVLNTSNHLSHRSYITVSELTRPIAFITTSAVLARPPGRFFSVWMYWFVGPVACL